MQLRENSNGCRACVVGERRDQIVFLVSNKACRFEACTPMIRRLISKGFLTMVSRCVLFCCVSLTRFLSSTFPHTSLLRPLT
jgi:hypothetical protein